MQELTRARGGMALRGAGAALWTYRYRFIRRSAPRSASGCLGSLGVQG